VGSGNGPAAQPWPPVLRPVESDPGWGVRIPLIVIAESGIVIIDSA